MTRISPAMLAVLAGVAFSAPLPGERRVRPPREPSRAAKKRAAKRNRKQKAAKLAGRRNRP